MNKAFSSFDFTTGKISNLDRQFPSYLSAWDNDLLILDNKKDSHFGYVHKGQAFIEYEGREFTIYEGMYFSLAGKAKILGGQGIVVSRENHRSFFQIGGPVENVGRLKYIDGCTDSLLISPVRYGDPCLNHLYFPKEINQTAHTHPSDRIGMIMSGFGECVAWNNGAEQIIDLAPGMIFCIHANGKHKFRTLKGHSMSVLAYHPESDFGPSDEDHPMINRTMVGGISAAKINSIKTQ